MVVCAPARAHAAAMRPTLAAHASSQAGLVTRRQAVEAGCTERELRSMTAVHGPWVVVRRGVYVERALWDDLGYDGRWALRDRAAHLNLHRPHVVSHDSAARAYELPLLRPRLPLVHITRPGVFGSRTEHGVKHHLTRRGVDDAEWAAGMPVTSLPRTALDVAREHGLEAGVVACDAALGRGVPRVALAAELGQMRCWPDITRARAALDHADPGAESVGESLARLLVQELGLGRPETQFPVPNGTSTFWCDLRLGCHMIEFDGRLKYRDRARGGVADRPIEDVLWDERQRQRLICAHGLGMSRLVWDDFWGAARPRALARLRAEYQVTLQRFGPTLPVDLQLYADQLRGRRRAS